MPLPPRTTALVGLAAGGGALAAAALASPLVGVVAVAGLADGFNPCSFAGLLVFASVTTAAFERGVLDCHSTAAAPEAAPAERKGIVRNGSVYIAGLFFTYVALGLGLLSAMNLLTEGHWVGKLAAVMSVGMGLWVLRDGLFPESKWKMEMPRFTRPGVQRALRATLLSGVFAAGILVGLCTVPCTGGIYLGVLALLSVQGSAGAGFGLLLLYNVMFVLPLVAVLALVTNHSTYRLVARWHLRTKNVVKLALGAVMLLLGFFTLVVLV